MINIEGIKKNWIQVSETVDLIFLETIGINLEMAEFSVLETIR